MKKISRRSFLRAAGLLAATALGAELSGCSHAASSSASSGAPTNAAHEPLHILTAGRDYTAFLELLHSKYPEIQVELDAYRGQNTSAYTRRQLSSGILPDIYTSTYFWEPKNQAEYLIDLSKYPVSDRYNASQMKQTDVDGATYLLPYDFTILGIGWNRSLFEREGWEVPTSFSAMQELLPKVKDAGITPSVCQINLPGIAFELFCNVSDTVFLNTHNGKQWQDNFLKNRTNASNSLQESADYFQQWINCGLINMDNPDFENDRASELFHQGDSAFFVGEMSQFSQNEDGTGDQYALMPYLSPDGMENAYVLRISRYYGLSKELEQPGNEQKLEDALHFLEVLSTVDAFESIIGSMPTAMCALTDFALPEDSPYCAPLAEVNSGRAAPFIYAGWDDYVANFGDVVRSWVNGDVTGKEALQSLDALQLDIIAKGGTETYATVTETLDNRQTAQLVGQMFLTAVGADAALISCNETKAGVGALSENGYGVSGSLLPGALTEEDLVAYLPTGWYSTISTVTLSGARVKELAALGYDKNKTGDTYPYVLVTAGAAELQDTQTYTVVLCGATNEVWEEGEHTDTGIVGLDAAKAYLQNVAEISSSILN